MMLEKQAQSELEYEDLQYAADLEVSMLNPQPELPNDADDGLPGEVIEEDQNDLVFTMPSVPGALDQSEIVLEEDGPAEIEVSDKDGDGEVEVAMSDPWDWKSHGLGNFLKWLMGMMKGVPPHSGRDTGGIERAIAYFEALDKEITKAMRSDYKNEIDSAKAEEARAEIENGLERLVERLEKLRTTKYNRYKKKAKGESFMADETLVKEAQKATHVGGIVITVPLFISRLARICINGTVSAGHDMEDMFERLSKKYKLTTREQAELMQLLQDMNYPIRRDRGFDLDEEIDETSSDNYDWAGNFQG